MAEADKWVAEEKTRSYWDKTYVVEYLDNTLDIQTKAALDKANQDALIADIKVKSSTKKRSLDETNVLVDQILALLGII